MAVHFSAFHGLDHLATVTLLGQFDPAWSMEYQTKFPVGSGSGLKLSSIKLKPQGCLPQDIERVAAPEYTEFAYLLTSIKYPILYAGVSKGNLKKGVFGAGRIGHHVRKILAIHQSLSTNHTSGWRHHAVERYQRILNDGTQKEALLSDVQICVGRDADGWQSEDHEGYILAIAFSAMSRVLGPAHPIAILNSGALRYASCEVLLPMNARDVWASTRRSLEADAG